MVLPDFDAAVNAIKKRILQDFSLGRPPDSVVAAWQVCAEQLLNGPTAKYFPQHLDGIEQGVVTDAHFSRWVNRFPMSTRKQLLQARVDLEAHPLIQKDFAIETITKVEKSGFIDLKFPAKDARAVNNCTPRSNVATGPYYWAYSLALKDTCGSQEEHWILWTPGQTSEYVGAFVDKLVKHFECRPGGKRIWAGDQAAFDCHQNAGSLEFECKLLERAGLANFVKVHKMGAIPTGTHQKYRIKFTAGKPARVSGRGCTSAFNVSVSIASVFYVLGPPGSHTWGGIFNGDDFLVIALADFIIPFEATIHSKLAELGLEIELLATNELWDCEFCQTVPYPTTEGTIFAPKIGRLMSRIGVSTSSKDPSLKSIAQGLYVTCFHVPFVRQLLDTYLLLTSDWDDTYTKDYLFHPQLNNFATRPHETCDATWDFVRHRYGLTKQHLQEFVSVLSTVKSVPSVIEWSHINTLVDRDE